MRYTVNIDCIDLWGVGEKCFRVHGYLCGVYYAGSVVSSTNGNCYIVLKPIARSYNEMYKRSTYKYNLKKLTIPCAIRLCLALCPIFSKIAMSYTFKVLENKAN